MQDSAASVVYRDVTRVRWLEHDPGFSAINEATPHVLHHT